MPKQLNIDFSVRADTSQARKEMQALQEQLSKLGTGLTGKTAITGMTSDIQKATEQVAQLKVQLKEATNVDTGRLDWSKFEIAMKKSGTSLETYRKSLQSLGADGTQAFTQLARAVSNSEVPIMKVSNLFTQLGTTLKNTIKWQISSTAIHAFIGGLQSAYGYAKDLNESLNNIRIVTGQTVDQMADLANEANRTAQALGTTTTAYTDAALIYYQQGIREQEEIAKRTETTLKLANVTKASAEEVSSQMTAIWNNFAEGEEDLELFADKITALGAATASSSAEIAQGLEKFASVSKTVGLSYDYATAALATVVAQTRQSADVVGTAFKTLFGRLEGLKLGDTLEDGVDLNKYSKALKSVGVDILDSNKQLKDMDTILDELGAKWQTIGKEEQIALAQTVGGVRQYTQLIALMENYDKFQNNLKTVGNAKGTLQEQQNIYAESWEASSKRVKAAWEDLYNKLLDDDFFIKLNNNLSETLKLVSKIIDNMGGVKGLLTQIAPILASMFSTQIITGMQDAAYNLQLMVPGGHKRMENRRNDQLKESMDNAFTSVAKGGSNEKEITRLKEDIQLEQTRLKYNKELNESNQAILNTIYGQIKARKEELEEIKKETEALEENNQKLQEQESKRIAIENKTALNNYDVKAQMQEAYKGGEFIGGVSSLQASGEKIDEINQETAEIILNQIKGFKAVYGETSLGNTEKVEEELTNIIKNEGAQAGEATKTFFDNLTERVEEITQNTNNLANDFRKSKLDTPEGFKNFQESYKNTADNTIWDSATQGQITKAFNEYIIKVKNNTDSFEEQERYLKELKERLSKYTQVNGEAATAQEGVNAALKEEEERIKAGKAIETGAANAMERGSETGGAKVDAATKGQHTTDPVQQMDEAGKKILDAQKTTTDWATSIYSVSRAFMTLNSTVSTLSNLFTTLTDKNKTFGEKVGASFQALITLGMQWGMLLKGNALQQIKNILITDADTIAAKANTKATREKQAAAKGAGDAKEEEAVKTQINTQSNNADTASYRTGVGGKKIASTKGAGAKLWVSGNSEAGVAGSTTALGSVLFVVAAIVAAVKTFTFVMDQFQSAHEENIKKLKEENEAIENWRQENSTALEAAHNYSDLNVQLKHSIITQEEYNKQLAETAKQLQINNAEALAQAGAYDLLEKSTKKAAEALEQEEYNKAIQSDINSRNLMASGDDSMLQEAMNMMFFGAGDFFGGLSGDYSNYGKTTKRIGTGMTTEAGEAALISELKQLNINGVQIADNGDISWDTATMTSNDLAKLSSFFADVTANSSKYGGEDNEIIKNLEKMNEDWAATAQIMQENASIEGQQEIKWYLENSDVAKTALDSGAKGYSTLFNALSSEFGEETARIVLKNYFSELEVQSGEVINTFAKTYGFDSRELFAEIEKIPEGTQEAKDAMEALTKESDQMAAGLMATGGSFEELTDYIQLCLDNVNVEGFGKTLATVQQLLDSLKFGDTLKEEDYNKLIEQFGEEVVSKYVQVLPDGTQRIIDDISELQQTAIQEAKEMVDNFRGEGAEKAIETTQKLLDNFDWGNSSGISGANEDSERLKTEIEGFDTKTQNLSLVKNIWDNADLSQLTGSVSSKATDEERWKALIEDFRKNSGGKEDLKDLTNEQIKEALQDLGIGINVTGHSGTGINAKDQLGFSTSGNTNVRQEASLLSYNEQKEDKEAEKKELDDKIKAWAELNGLMEKYQQLKENPFALEGELVNQTTTFEELQDLAEQGYISNEKQQKSIAGAAATTAKALDLDSEALMEQAKYLQKNNAQVEGSYEEAMQLALAYQRQSKALTDLNSNMDSYADAIKNSERGSKEYTSAINSLEEDMQNLFNTDDTIGEDFILKHLKDIKKAAKGDEEAIKDLQIAYSQTAIESANFDAATQNTINSLYEAVDKIDFEKLEIGVGVDTEPALQDLWNFQQEALANNDITVDQFKNAWNAMGFEMEPITKTVPIVDPTTGETTGYAEQVVGWKNPKYTGNARATVSPKKSSSKGKGKSRSKKDKKDYEDEFERYYTINRQIKDQEDLIERLGKAKDRAYGRAKIQNIEKEKKALEGQYDLEKKKLKEIQDYYKKDQKALNFFGAKYDENGVVTNYDEMIKREVAAYNKAVDKYNKGGSEKDFNKASERYEDFKKKLKQYDDTNELYQDQLEKIQDLQNQIFDKDLEVIEYQVQVDIEVDDDKLNYLEYELDRIQKKAFSTGEALSNMVSQLYVNIDKANVNRNALEETLGLYGLDLDSIDSLSDKQISKLGLTEQTVEDLRNYRDQLLEAQKAIDELEESILNGPLESIKEWNEEFDYQEDKIANNINLLKQYQNISELIYESAPGIDDQYIYNLMESQYKQGVNGIEAAHAELEANKYALQEARESYEQAIAEGMNEQNLNTLKQNLREMEDQVAKSENDMLKLTEENLKRAQDLLKKFVDTAAEKLKKALGASDWDMTQFDRLKELDDQYLDDYEKIYEFSKLTRDINNSIDDADTIRQKERLREITQEIADIEASGKEVSQYEIDALRKKYELRLAEIALEDAQAAKSTVRMSRDNDGNWSYVYTADNDNVDKARQNYEDKLYEYQKLNSEFIKEQEGNFLKLEQEYVDAMTKIAEDSSLNQEDKEMRLQETQAYYQRMAEIMSDQLGIALNKNSELYTKDWLDYSKTTGYKISKMEDYQTKIDDTYIGHLQPTIDSSTELLDQFMEYTVGDDGFYSQLETALDDYYQKQDETLQAAGTSLAGYAGDVTEAMEAAEDSSKDAADSVTTSAQEMRDAFDEVIDKVNDLNKMNLDKLREDNKKTIKSIGDLIEKYKDLGEQIDKTNSKANNGGSTGGNYSGGNSSSNSPKNPSDPTPKETLTLSKTKIENMAKFLQEKSADRNTSGGSRIWYEVTNGGKYFKNSGIKSTVDDFKKLIKKELVDSDVDKIRNKAKANAITTFNNYKFDTGGYTGSWGTEGRLAMLHQKELVLNAKDTENMLNTVQMVRDIVASIDTRAAAAGAVNIGSGYANNVSTGSSDLNQNVHIEASFPNATDHNEIELALTNLVNRASQYAGRKTL